MPMDGVERRLSAILSADVVGYSRLMAEDEDGTVRRLAAYRDQIGLMVEQHGGRIVDFTGDNFLAEFPSAVNATRCAVEIQGVLKARNLSLAEDHRMEFRIGIHVGEVRAEGERIFGEGVNIASRLEGLAEPGSVCISGTVHEQVESKLGLRCDDLGEQSVKNIPKPVRVFRILDEAPSVTRVTGTGAKDRPMIVVLPFENLGPAAQAYFAAGMTEAVTSRLARLPDLGVISHTSAVKYAKSAASIREMAEDGVDWALDGTVLWAGERVRITQKLIRIADDTHQWVGHYEKKINVENLFAIQSEIAEQVSLQLGLSILELASSAEDDLPTTSMEAYQAYLRGVDAEERPGDQREDLLLAVAMFRKAVELDPSFALAWARLGHTYGWLLLHDPSAGHIGNASLAVKKAVELDPGLPEVQVAEATLLNYGHREYEKAYRKYRIAFEGRPSDGRALGGMGFMRVRQGRFEEALELLGQATQVAPRSSELFVWQAKAAMYLRQYEEADRLYRRAVVVAPDYSAGYAYRVMNMFLWKGVDAADSLPLPDSSNLEVVWQRLDLALNLGRYEVALRLIELLPPEFVVVPRLHFRPKGLLQAWVYEGIGREEPAREAYEAARRSLEAHLEEDPEDPLRESALALVHAGLGNKKDSILHAEKGLELLPPSIDAYEGVWRQIDVAIVYGQVGKTEAALDILEELLAASAAPLSVAWIEGRNEYASLRDHPRYQLLMEQYR